MYGDADMNPPPNKKAKHSEAEPSLKKTVKSTVVKTGDWQIHTGNDYRHDAEDDDRDSLEAGNDKPRQKFTQGKLERYVVLGTANIRLQFGTYISHCFRAICDTAAQAGMISIRSVKANAFPLKQCMRHVNGVGGSSTMTRKIQTHVLPWFDSKFAIFTELLVSETFGGTQPWVSLSSLRPIDNELTLADPHFDVPAPVDILLAGDVWSQIICSMLYKHISGVVMHETMLGYVILGGTLIPTEAFGTAIYNATTTQAIEEPYEEERLDKLLKSFFDDECIPEAELKTTAEQQAVEDAYKAHTFRRPNGRFVTKLPLKPGKTLGESRNLVMRRFFALERKLQKDDKLKQKYIEFMREMSRLGHM